MAVQTQIQMRRGTASSWTSTNPILAAGEIGFESDTNRIKIGNGTSTWSALTYTASAVANTYTYTATAGQTTFSGADANGNTLSYVVGAEQVYLNGVLLQRTTDYTATNGTSVVLASGAVVSDILTVLAFSTFTISSDIPKSTLSAKGSLVGASAASTPAEVAVGANDQILVADSTQASGVAWKSYGAQFVAGKNKIINGDFGIWQRGTSIAVTTATNTYTADRWFVYSNFTAGSASFSQQTFTPGTAPVSGYEGTYFGRFTNGSTATYFEVGQKIEDVRVFAGQTTTLSFWAKASTTLTITPSLNQNFGSGGSASVVNSNSNLTVTTSWQRFTTTFTLPSISGKTIGTGSFLYAVLNYASGTLGSATFDIWGVQVEAGSTATPFTTATGTLAGELAACQRYYWRSTSGASYQGFVNGMCYSTTQAMYALQYPVPMRAVPTSLDYSTLGTTASNGTNTAITSLSLAYGGTMQCTLWGVVASGLTAGNGTNLQASNSTSAYLGLSAEL